MKTIVEIDVKPKQLYEGCIQAAIAHAVAVGKYPELNYEHMWDGINYCMNDSQGCRAVITFHNEYIIAVFQDIHKADWNKDALDYLEGASGKMIQVAKEEALQYVLEDVNGITKPVITAAFWGTWEQLVSTQTLADILNNGGNIIHSQLLPFDSAMDEWRQHYDLEPRQIALIRCLFDKKIKSKAEVIKLFDDEIQFLYGDIEECFVSLGELNMVKAN